MINARLRRRIDLGRPERLAARQAGSRGARVWLIGGEQRPSPSDECTAEALADIGVAIYARIEDCRVGPL